MGVIKTELHGGDVHSGTQPGRSPLVRLTAGGLHPPLVTLTTGRTASLSALVDVPAVRFYYNVQEAGLMSQVLSSKHLAHQTRCSESPGRRIPPPSPPPRTNLSLGRRGRGRVEYTHPTTWTRSPECSVSQNSTLPRQTAYSVNPPPPMAPGFPERKPTAAIGVVGGFTGQRGPLEGLSERVHGAKVLGHHSPGPRGFRELVSPNSRMSSVRLFP